MEYGQIAKSKSVNNAIYYCFQYIEITDTRKFVRKFKQQPHNNIQVMHTFRELLLGAFLASNNLLIRSEYKVGNKTPDWCIFNKDFQVQCIVELVNFHVDARTEADVVTQIQAKGIWCNFMKPNTDRLYQTIWEKAGKYNDLATKHDLEYVIAIFGDFLADVGQDELDECLFRTEAPLFELYPNVSGILFFEESSGDYSFIYKANPFATRTIILPDGWFETRKR